MFQAAVIEDVVIVLKTRLESQLSRINCQTFSTGLSSGARGGSGIRVILSGTSRAREVCHPAWHDDGMGTGFNDAGDLFEMGVQRFRVGIGHNEAGSFALVRADEDIS